MFEFAEPRYLLFIPALVILWGVVVFFSKRSQKRLKTYFADHLLSSLAMSQSSQKKRWKLGLQLTVLALSFLALAQPQWGEGTEEVKSEGVEIVLMVDVSTSMLAEDVKPSRLAFAKKELERFLTQLGGDRVGVVAFAGSAALLSPMTVDKSALMMYLDSLTPSSVGSQGTDFSRALLEAAGAFDRGGVEQSESRRTTRVIVIASDGENNEKGAFIEAEKLAKQGIRIFSLAFGTSQGGPIPLRDENGYLQGYKKNRQGKTILTRTEGDSLKKLAQAGQGSFYHVTFGGKAIENLVSDVRRLQKTQFSGTQVMDYTSWYQAFLLLALFLAGIEFLLSDRVSQRILKSAPWLGRF